MQLVKVLISSSVVCSLTGIFHGIQIDWNSAWDEYTDMVRSLMYWYSTWLQVASREGQVLKNF